MRTVLLIAVFAIALSGCSGKSSSTMAMPASNEKLPPEVTGHPEDAAKKKPR